ncbi:SDR family oxidoreductase [Limosilactobacillus equigenerosi]|uniref:NAD(P)-binding domain-containing protein n=1 Tax=Limosilactobacillus equigenerosi DSM 18793 = JCM 14505 TaxID=1423742 RepID=A0A0R1UUT4_9LACO|nr:SDR family oxidoreductase [Limosilactobacillus equigenerosi]KRL96532.1 hypothetical protein FC21_GL000904 [Limosilactobacillus equigenerosi DSM 18793 = JCM 14505]
MIGITGVTGHIGNLVAQHLTSQDFPLRLLARSPQWVAHFPKATVMQASYENTPATVQALTGVETLFMVSAKEHPQRLQQHFAMIDAAKQAGVKHIVYLSFYHAALDATFTLARDYKRTEDYIIAHGFDYTFVRDNFYGEFFVDLATQYHEFRAPAGNGKIAPIFQADVAAVVAKILTNVSAYRNQIVNLTGSKEYTLADMSNIFTNYLNTTVPYIDETVAEAYQSRQAWPAEQWEYDSWVSTYTSIANGENAGISPDVQRILGRPAMTIEAYLQQR